MKIICITLLLLLSSTCAFAQSDPLHRSWNQPVEPFRLVGNIYYVGASDIASFLITSPKGHILLDGGFEETAPQIRDNIRKLGFKVEDVKFLLNSQAHFDHAAGLAELKRITGAKFVASKEDGALIARGGKGDFNFGDSEQFPPTQPDRIINDGEKVEVDGSAMTAHLTPGHTKGCTTWTADAKEDGHTHHVVFVCSTSFPDYKLVNNPNYPNIIQDFRHTFRLLKTLPCDVMLGAHGQFFHLKKKRETQKLNPKSNPFINADDYSEYLSHAEADFEAEVKKQQQK